MAAQKQDDQLERTFNSYVRIQDVVQKTCLGRWTFGRSGERGSGISVLPARYDDDDDMCVCICISICLYICERDRQTDNQRDRVCVCVMYVFIYLWMFINVYECDIYLMQAKDIHTLIKVILEIWRIVKVFFIVLHLHGFTFITLVFDSFWVNFTGCCCWKSTGRKDPLVSFLVVFQSSLLKYDSPI